MQLAHLWEHQGSQQLRWYDEEDELKQKASQGTEEDD